MRSQASTNPQAGIAAWSIIARPCSADEDRQNSLLRLCVGYFYPVYTQICSCGHSPEFDYEYAQGCIEELAREFSLDRPIERFRPCLYRHLEEFCNRPKAALKALESSPFAGGVERRYLAEGDQWTELSVAFEQRYARELMVRTLTRLKDEAEYNGKQKLYAALVDYLASDPSSNQARQLSITLKMSPLALAIALQRLCARYAEISYEELASERAAFHTFPQ